MAGRIRNRFCVACFLAAFLAVLVSPGSAALAKPLNQESLKAMLEGLGYVPKEGTYSNGKKFFRISQSTSKLTLIVNFDLSNPKNLWIYLNLPKISPDVEIPNEVLRGLLQANEKAYFMTFSYVKKRGSFRLFGTLPNHDISPVDLRRIIVEASDTLIQTVKFWNPKNWSK